jgi:hypothetical protein
MTGYIMAYGACINCGTTMTFNPHYVPSIRVHGAKEPLCRGCFAEWNRIHRESRGLPPLSLHPLAYEPGREDGLDA